MEGNIEHDRIFLLSVRFYGRGLSVDQFNQLLNIKSKISVSTSNTPMWVSPTFESYEKNGIEQIFKQALSLLIPHTEFINSLINQSTVKGDFCLSIGMDPTKGLENISPTHIQQIANLNMSLNIGTI